MIDNLEEGTQTGTDEQDDEEDNLLMTADNEAEFGHVDKKNPEKFEEGQPEVDIHPHHHLVQEEYAIEEAEDEKALQAEVKALATAEENGEDAPDLTKHSSVKAKKNPEKIEESEHYSEDSPPTNAQYENA